MSNYAFDRKPYMPTTSSCLVGPRAESISMSCEQWFEVVGYMARPGRVSSFEAEIPKDGRDKVFENLFPGQVYRPIELGDTPSGLPNKLGAQFRINFASLDNCPAVLNDSIRAGNGGCVGRINKSMDSILAGIKMLQQSEKLRKTMDIWKSLKKDMPYNKRERVHNHEC